MIEPWTQFQSEPWTPVDAERALRWVLRAMLDAQEGLRTARDAEVGCKHDYESARRRAWFDEECPKPSRGGATVADRDAFVDRATAQERQDFEIAQATTAAAQDHLRTLNSQSVVLSALAKNVAQTYGVIGVGR